MFAGLRLGLSTQAVLINRDLVASAGAARAGPGSLALNPTDLQLNTPQAAGGQVNLTRKTTRDIPTRSQVATVGGRHSSLSLEDEARRQEERVDTLFSVAYISFS